VPVYSIAAPEIPQIDWNIALAEKRGKVNECGLYDLNHKSWPVADAYKVL
jgi:hypothetical protein